jgi:DNA polymerase-3 subunit epsilon/exodeoxyribonuclease X
MLIFIDIETTGIEVKDKICSIALLNESNYMYELINEGKKISAEASSIHHITNEDIENKLSFKQSEIYKFLQKNNKEENTLVTDNSTFTLEKLLSHGFEWKGLVVDTIRVTKHLIPECEFFSLQILRYELKLYKSEKILQTKYGIKDAIVAHNALSDALVNRLLFEFLENESSLEIMHELSFKKVLLSKFSFGKYKGKYIEEICFNDSSYVRWLLNSATELDEDIRYSLEYYLEG